MRLTPCGESATATSPLTAWSLLVSSMLAWGVGRSTFDGAGTHRVYATPPLFMLYPVIFIFQRLVPLIFNGSFHHSSLVPPHPHSSFHLRLLHILPPTAAFLTHHIREVISTLWPQSSTNVVILAISAIITPQPNHEQLM